MGELARKGESRPATRDDLSLNERAQSLQALQQVPVLQRTDNPHEYLFFALFDGTGQDVDNPDQLPTNVGVLKAQVYELRRDSNLRIGGHYVKGIGTQDNPIERLRDQYRPFTWDDKIEEAYQQLAEQTRKWQQQDPEAQIRIADVGYSRGAVLAAGLARLVDRYGIVDPEDLTFGRDARGNITVQSNRPTLVPPGQVAQAMGLFDPVGTNMPEHYDARLTPSVISALSMTAAHERRGAFPHQAILDPGLSPDRRFVNVLVPGGHSNAGGGNQAPGLETLAFNQMADYLNGLSDRPLFQHRPLPDDLDLYTVYQARGATAVPGLDKDGARDLRQELASCKIVDPCRDAEPINQALADQFETRQIRIDPTQAQQLQSLMERLPTQQRTAQPDLDPVPHAVPSEPPRQGVAPQAQIPTVPDHLQDFRHPEHPRHIPYQRFVEGLQKADAGFLQDSTFSRYTPEQHERLAAGLTAAQGTQPYFNEVGNLVERDGVLWASNLTPSFSLEPLWVHTDLARTLAQPPEAAAARWREHALPARTPVQTQAQAQGQAQTIDPQPLSATDLRHPDHPRHAMYADARDKLSHQYARWGQSPEPSQLDRAAAQSVVAARAQRMDTVGDLELYFAGDPTRGPNLMMRQNPADPAAPRASVDAAKLAQAPEVDTLSTQLQQVEQQVARMQQQEQQQQQEREMAPGRSM